MSVVGPNYGFPSGTPSGGSTKNLLKRFLIFRITKNRNIMKRIKMTAFVFLFFGLGAYGAFATFRLTSEEPWQEECQHISLAYTLALLLCTTNMLLEAAFLAYIVYRLPRNGTNAFKRSKLASLILALLKMISLSFFGGIMVYSNKCYHNYGHHVIFLSLVVHIAYYSYYFKNRSYRSNEQVDTIDRRLRDQMLDPTFYDTMYPGQRKTVEPRRAVTKF